jgi:hypothetical protein
MPARLVPLLVRASAVLLAAAVPIDGQTANPSVAGYVLSVRGPWTIGTSAEAAASGRTLTAGDTIRAGPAPWRGNEIVLVLRSGSATRYRCVESPPTPATPESWNCAHPIVVARPTGPSLTTRMLDAVMNHFGKHASRPASLVSRGILDRDLRESVATLRDEHLDLSDALAAIPAGDYNITLAPIEVAGAVVQRKGAVIDRRLSWDPRTPTPVAGTGMAAGLYELGMDGSSDVAWVLVCASNCDAVRAEFASVRDLTVQWSGHVSASDVRAFVRAALDLLRQPAR